MVMMRVIDHFTQKKYQPGKITGKNMVIWSKMEDRT